MLEAGLLGVRPWGDPALRLAPHSCAPHHDGADVASLPGKAGLGQREPGPPDTHSRASDAASVSNQSHKFCVQTNSVKKKAIYNYIRFCDFTQML